MTWRSPSFMPNNMSCFSSIRSEIRGLSRAHKLAAGPKILSGCCKRVARILNSKMWSHFEPSHSGCKLCHVKACTYLHWTLAPWLQPAASPSVHATSMAQTGAVCAASSSASFRQHQYSQLKLSALVNASPKQGTDATGDTKASTHQYSSKY